MADTKIWARLDAGRVAEIMTLLPDLTPGEHVFVDDRYTFKDLTAISPQPDVGWTLADDGRAFSEPPASAVFVPESCSKLGLKRALAESGEDAVFKKPEWAAVKAFIQGDEARSEEWELASRIRRSDPLLGEIAAKRGYDAATLDKILVRANALAI